MTRPAQFMDIFPAFIIILQPFSKVTHLFFMPSCNPCYRTPCTIHTLGNINSLFCMNTLPSIIQRYVIMSHTLANTTSIPCKVKRFITEFLCVSIGYLEVFSLCLCLSLSNCLKTCLDRWQKNMYNWFHPDTFLAGINFNIPFSTDKHSRNSRIISTASLSWQLSFSKYRLFIWKFVKFAVTPCLDFISLFNGPPWGHTKD